MGLLLFLLFSFQRAEALNCNYALSSPNSLETIFAENYDNPRVCFDLECNLNVLRLYKKFKEAKPGLEASDFKVLLIADKAWFDGFGPSSYMITPRAKFEIKGKDQHWFFHVVLEYGGMIYDLDYLDRPRVLSRHYYLRDMFMPAFRLNTKLEKVNVYDSLELIEIPGEDYLSYPATTLVRREFFRDLITRLPKKPLKNL